MGVLICTSIHPVPNTGIRSNSPSTQLDPADTSPPDLPLPNLSSIRPSFATSYCGRPRSTPSLHGSMPSSLLVPSPLSIKNVTKIRAMPKSMLSFLISFSTNYLNPRILWNDCPTIEWLSFVGWHSLSPSTIYSFARFFDKLLRSLRKVYLFVGGCEGAHGRPLVLGLGINL